MKEKKNKNISTLNDWLLLNRWNIDTVLLTNALVCDFSNCLFDENLCHKIHISKLANSYFDELI